MSGSHDASRCALQPEVVALPDAGAIVKEPQARRLLTVESLSKRFGETQALSACSLEVGFGEIHALVGENGSGKSTLVKILSGVVSAGAGHIELDAAPFRCRNPRDAQRAGVVAVFQETLVARELSVLDNIFMGQDSLFRPNGPRVVEVESATRVLAQLGLGTVDVDAPVWTLSLAQQQLVTIARALVQRWRLLLLDEATSALDVDGRDRLFSVLTEACRRGDVSVLFVTHRMDEVMNSAHRITVLRGGKTVGVLGASEARMDLLLNMMAGESLTEEARQEASSIDAGIDGLLGTRAARSETGTGAGPSANRPEAGELAVLRVSQFAMQPSAKPFDLTLRAGEIVGVAALEGHGQVDLLRCIAGLTTPHSGRVVADREGSEIVIRHPRDAARAGVVYVPNDRKTEGILPGLSVLDNLLLPSLGRLSRFGVLRRRRMAREAHSAVSALRVKTASVRSSIDSLSGGNQQKVVMGRWLLTRPRVLVLNDPMRGVDPGARRDLLGILREAARDGVAILLFSTELEELLTLCPQVAVVRDHSITQLLAGERLTMDGLIAAMFGQAVGEEADHEG